MITYIGGIIKELKLTRWLTPRELLNLLVYTIVLCGIIALMITGLDILYRNIFNQLLNIPFI